ncbi:hypothetical protein QC762_115325 [Podospora pseudocomata]|uniref:Uncharacterized protein n=1 Tax=Podospora pseudocomata TaxID=2093779 RepID=A0ABR0GWB8_9PEZI|nr:hypothetical protein QC762_115325 [Podospora pseudocomata]
MIPCRYYACRLLVMHMHRWGIIDASRLLRTDWRNTLIVEIIQMTQDTKLVSMTEAWLCQRVLQMDPVPSKCVMDHIPGRIILLLWALVLLDVVKAIRRSRRGPICLRDRCRRTLKSLSAPQLHLLWQRLPWRCCASPGGQLV